MLKQLRLAAIALLAAGALASCSDDETADYHFGGISFDKGILVINQGNQAGNIPGSLDLYHPVGDSVTSNVFTAVNQAALGFSPQNATTCRNRLFFAMYDDNCLQVTEKGTLKSLGRVPAPQVEHVASDGKYVYAACNNGFLERIDPVSFDTAMVYVGPNPMCVAVAGGNAYVSISDAWWGSSYQNGLRVARVDLSTFRVAKEIPVGTNPTTLALDGQGSLYVACQGNYYDIQPEVWKIDLATDQAGVFVRGGSFIAAGAGKLYTVTSSYDANWNATYSYAAYNADGTALQEFALSELPPQPSGITVNDGKIYITSDGSSAYDAYTLPGLLYVYSATGTLLSKQGVGVHPYSLVFLD